MRTSHRLGLSVLEAGWVLGKTEPQVRRLLQKGVLRYAVRPRWIEPESIRAITGDDWAASEALDALLSGELVAPRPPRRYGRPPYVFPHLLEYLLRDARLVSHTCSPEVCGPDCPKPGDRFYDVFDSPWD